MSDKMSKDPIADALITIKNNEIVNKRECIVKPKSKLLIEILKILQKYNYIGDFEVVEDGRGGYIKIQLIQKINDIKAIKPRFSVGKDEWVKWEERYLPNRWMGILIVSTSKGVMTNKEAKELGIGGRLLAYVY